MTTFGLLLLFWPLISRALDLVRGRTGKAGD
jgi:hypothetical protein